MAEIRAEAAAEEALRESRQIALAAAEAMREGKGEEILVLDLSSLSDFADFFVIGTGLSGVHMRALADRVQEKLAGRGIQLSHVEGEESTSWILLDYLSVLVHIFSVESREYYRLERLWGDGILVNWESAGWVSA